MSVAFGLDPRTILRSAFTFLIIVHAMPFDADALSLLVVDVGVARLIMAVLLA